MTTIRKTMIGASFALLLGCAHAPPTELVEARSTYQRVSAGPAKEYDPAGLHVAKNSLLVAERSFDRKEDSWLVRGQAYIAMRKAQLAESVARTKMHEQELAEAQARQEQLEEQEVAKAKAELESVKDELAEKDNAVSMTARELAAEKERRMEAERRAALAATELARIASVKQDDRGMVVTLSGSILFASAKYDLLPGARAKLDEVADALLAGDPDATFVVEGHTDSQGKDEANQFLSLNRAKAVRDYLISRGIVADRITAEGYGERRPVADNKSAEGRAMNRRVELVVKPGNAVASGG
jgi:outer membrane protein OmpA-like peptidoglycan-associated protein